MREPCAGHLGVSGETHLSMDVFSSDRISWMWRMFFPFSQFPDETEKEESRSAGEIDLSRRVSMVYRNTHLWFDTGAFMCRLRRLGVFVLPSGKDKRRKNIMAIPFILSDALKKIQHSFMRSVEIMYWIEKRCSCEVTLLWFERWSRIS